MDTNPAAPTIADPPELIHETAGTTDACATRRATEEEFLELGRARRKNCSPRADAYTALQLIFRAGWTPRQAADFLDLEPQSVLAWSEAWMGNRLFGVGQLRDPSYAN